LESGGINFRPISVFNLESQWQSSTNHIRRSAST
jgi:hypothetical protein